MDADFGGTVRDLAAFAHVVPEKVRTSATEVAALVLLAGQPIDPETPDQLVDAVPLQARSTAFIVVSALRRLKPKQRSNIFDWARVLLVFRSGKPEDWEVDLEKRGKRRKR